MRNATIFGPPGRLYVYRHLGIHTCANLVCGPARLAVALGLDLALDGTDVVDPGGVVVVHLAGATTMRTVVTGPRVGVSGPGADGDQFPWRFWLADEPTVSEFRASGRRPTPRDRDVRVRRQVRQTRPDTASVTRPHDEEDLRE